MSGVNNPSGFRPLMQTLSGAPCRVAMYGKPASDANAIFQFDFVKKVASSVAVPEGGDPVPSVQTYYQGTPGTTLIVGASLNYGAASAATMHSVVDTLDALFAAQTDSASAETTAAIAGKNANVSIATAGSATTKLSGMQVSASSIATTAGLDLRILRLLNVPNNPEGTYPIVEVVIMKHAFAQGSAGV